MADSTDNTTTPAAEAGTEGQAGDSKTQPGIMERIGSGFGSMFEGKNFGIGALIGVIGAIAGLLVGGPLVALALGALGFVGGPLAANAMNGDKTKDEQQNPNTPEGKRNGHDRGVASRSPSREPELDVVKVSEIKKVEEDKPDYTETIDIDGEEIQVNFQMKQHESYGSRLMVDTVTLTRIDAEGNDITETHRVSNMQVGMMGSGGIEFDQELVAKLNNKIAGQVREKTRQELKSKINEMPRIFGDSNSYAVDLKNGTSYLAHVKGDSIEIQNRMGEELATFDDLKPRVLANGHAVARLIGKKVLEVDGDKGDQRTLKLQELNLSRMNVQNKVELEDNGEEVDKSRPVSTGRLLINGRPATYNVATTKQGNDRGGEVITGFTLKFDHAETPIELPINGRKLLGKYKYEFDNGTQQFTQESGVIEELAEEALKYRDKDIKTLKSSDVELQMTQETVQQAQQSGQRNDNVVSFDLNSREYGRHVVTIEHYNGKFTALVKNLGNENTQGSLKVLDGTEFSSVEEAMNESLHHIRKQHGDQPFAREPMYDALKVTGAKHVPDATALPNGPESNLPSTFPKPLHETGVSFTA